MEEFNNLMGGFAVAMTLPNIMYMLIGIILGVLKELGWELGCARARRGRE